MEFVDATVREIDTRLGELREEGQRLEAARGALVGHSTGANGSRPGRERAGAVSDSSGQSEPRRRGPGRPKGSRRGGNTRSKEALNLVRSRPGVTIPEIASELKILPNYLYRVMPKLIEDGQIRKDGQGFHPVG